MPKNLALSKQYLDRAGTFLMHSLLLSRRAASVTAMSDLETKILVQELNGECGNLAIAVNKYQQQCLWLEEHWTDRLETLLGQNP